MRAAIMQPYFFPYFGHFALLAACDVWVVFDISQYTPKTWMNRNRVLHPASGWSYLTVPLAQASIHTRTHEAKLLDPAAARRSVLGSLSHYRRHAPYYAAVTTLVHQAFDAAGTSLTRLNVAGLAAVCTYLGLPFHHRLASDLPLALPSPPGPGDWAPLICSAIGATAYVNPIAGAHLFDPAAFARRGLALHFAHAAPFAYQPRHKPFIPDLSILDVLMWNGPAHVVAALQTCTTLTGFPAHAAAL